MSHDREDDLAHARRLLVQARDERGFVGMLIWSAAVRRLAAQVGEDDDFASPSPVMA